MAKDRTSLSASVRLSAIVILENLQKVKTKPQAGLERVKKYLAEGHKQPGRRHGATTVNDDQRLRRMKELLHTGEARSIHDAARQVAQEMPDIATPDSIVRRLQEKYPAFAKKYKETPSDE